jgi:hypothetical protein
MYSYCFSIEYNFKNTIQNFTFFKFHIIYYNNMKTFDSFIIFIIFIKVLFIIFSLIHVYFKLKNEEETPINIFAVYWRGRLEFIFTICMAIVLIYLFNPRYNNEKLITSEVKLLLYLFGFILLIIAKWGEFIKENRLFQYLQEIIQ